MFHKSENVFTKLSPKELVDIKTYNECIDPDTYVKTRVNVDVPLHSKPNLIYSFELKHTADAYMDFEIPDNDKDIINVEIYRDHGISNDILDTFYWNEETRSWRSHFNETCPFFVLCSPWKTYSVHIRSTIYKRYTMNMTKINFSNDMHNNISASSFDTFMGGKIIRYEKGNIRVLENKV